MLITSHLLGTLVISNALSLNNPEIGVALAVGIGVDIDHFFINKKWITDIRDFVKYRKITYGVNQHSWFQEILFGSVVGTLIGLLIAYFYTAIRWWVLPLFLSIHIIQDYLMKNEHKPFVPLSQFKFTGWIRSGTKIELLISFIGLALLLI